MIRLLHQCSWWYIKWWYACYTSAADGMLSNDAPAIHYLMQQDIWTLPRIGGPKYVRVSARQPFVWYEDVKMMAITVINIKRLIIDIKAGFYSIFVMKKNCTWKNVFYITLVKMWKFWNNSIKNTNSNNEFTKHTIAMNTIGFNVK